MAEIKGGADFLKRKYPDLAKSKEVSSAQRASREKNGNVPGIQRYLDRLTRLVLDLKNRQEKADLGDEDKSMRPKALHKLRQALIRIYIANNSDKLAQGAAVVEQRAARSLGHGNVRYDQEDLAKRAEIAKKDLTSSLDNWLAYLSDPNEDYPDWFKYYTFRSILTLSQYDKDKQEFPARSKGTTKLFPDLDRGALGYLKDRIEASFDNKTLDVLREQEKLSGTPDQELLTKESAEAFGTQPFCNHYAEAISKKGAITPELRAVTQGEWKKFPMGSDPAPLWSSLQGKGTAWCTAGYGTAATQLEGGDFYVYYTKGTLGNPTIPRIAIRMDGDRKIGEVRGVADTAQNLEGNMTPILDTKLAEFGSEGQKYLKKSANMKQLTAIEDKLKQNQAAPLTKEELRFLYEIDSPLQGFGYDNDPRIKEIRSLRNIKEDLAIALDCSPDQITDDPNLITADTRAYLGDLTPMHFHVLNTRTTPLIIYGKTNFKNCSSLTAIPEGIVFHGGAIFTDCRNLTTIPQGTIFNGYASFEGCTSLTSIPKGTVFTGDANFYGCSSLTAIQEGTVFNGSAFFSRCSSLSAIPEGTVFNGGANFVNCTSLTTIPEGTVFNGGADFYGCTSLNSISKNTVINGNIYFRNCSTLSSIPEGIIFNGDALFSGCSSLTSIPEGTIFSKDADFSGCSSLTSFPKDTVFNGEADFRDCSSLTTIPEGTIFYGDALFSGCSSLTSIPQGLVFYGHASFSGCTNLTSIPEGTIFNGWASFSGCTHLTSIPENTVFAKIANFTGCSSLTFIPKGTVFNGDARFSGCSSLTTIPEDTVFNGDADFSGCNLSNELKSQLERMKQQGKIKGELIL